MHRRHYKLLAEAFARQCKEVDEMPGKDFGPGDLERLIDDIEDEVCLALSQDNPAFSHQKFTDASGRKT